MALWLHWHSFRDFNTCIILVYMFLNGRGCLTGGGLHGWSLASAICTGQPTIAVAITEKKFAFFSSLLFCFVVSVYVIFEQWRRSGGH